MSLVKHNNIWKRIETIKVRRDGAWVDYTSVYAWYSKDSISAWYEIDIDATPVGPAINVWQIYADDPDADTLEEVGLSFLSLDKPFIGFLSGQSETLENQADLERLVTTLDDVAAFKWSKVEGKQGEKGEDGSFVSFIFRNAINQPNTPTGGTYDGSVETFPDNTTDRPNFTNGLITWVSKTRYYKLGNAWSNNGWSEFSEYVIKGGKGDKGEGGDAAPEKFSWTVYSDSQTSGAIYTSNDPRRLFIGVVHNNSTINPATGPNDHGIYTWSLGLNVIDLRESDYLFNKLGADNINVTELFAEQILASGFIKYQGASQASVILGGESTGPLFQTKNTTGADSFTISRAGQVSFNAAGIVPGSINFNALSQQAIESLVGQTGTPTPDSGGSKSVSFEASAAISKTLDVLKHGSNTIKLSVYGSMSRNSSTPNGNATARVTVNEKIGNGSFQEARTDLVTAGEFQDGDTYWVDWNYDVEFTRNPTADNDVTYQIVLSAFNNWGPFKGAFSLIAEETAVGSGGGGSSDELDGQNGAYYLNYANFTGTVPTWNQDTTGNAATANLATKVTITSALFNGEYEVLVNVSGNEIYSRNTFKYSGSTDTLTVGTVNGDLSGTASLAGYAQRLDGGGTANDLNTIPFAGNNNALIFQRYSNSPNQPPGRVNNANAVLFMNSHTGPYGKQLAFADNDDLYMRRYTNGSFAGWKKLIHQDNIPQSITGNAATATNANNANLLDNRDSSDFATSKERVVNNLNDPQYRKSGMYGFNNAPSNRPGGTYQAMIVANNADVGLQIVGGYSSNQLYFRGYANSGGIYYPWHTITHSGNDSNYAKLSGNQRFLNSIGVGGAIPGGNLASKGIAIGDSDTGFKQAGDGILDHFCNDQRIARVTTGSFNIYRDLYLSSNKVYAIDCVATSDRRLKENLSRISDPIGKLKGITGWEFNFVSTPGVRSAHTMAQDVRKVFAVAVSEDDQGRLSVSLTAEIALLIEVCKSQQNDIEKQQYIIQKQQYNIEDMQRRIYKLENK
jgi:hypothetical protein